MTLPARMGRLGRVLASLAFLWSLRSVEAAEGAKATDRPDPPAEAAQRMALPAGFTARLFAAEPDVRQPIGFAIDDRARVWVAECYSYPAWKTTGSDRIVILEDEDGDGRSDRRKVFAERIANLTGLALGFGGVWACATPNLLFLPDRDGDDVPDGEPEIVLDGWSLKIQHNAFNGLRWGPDGWLYGMHGILATALVGPPGAPPEKRVELNCGVWRYHPVRRAFEAVAHGTTNPWGMDFDERGELFITNCVIAHLWRVVPGAHYQRMYGEDFSAHLYALMDTCADHLHWGGGPWQESRGGVGKHDAPGGGHAHAGAMIYLGDNWPPEYRGNLFTCNIHGNRINRDVIRRQGSGHVASHAPDILRSPDTWFRGLDLQYGPDGSVFVSDWSDTAECHDTDEHGAHHESGRLYKVSYGAPAPLKVDLARVDDQRLVELQGHPNEWYARHARRLLQERAASGRDLSAAWGSLRGMLRADGDPVRQLRAVWSLWVTGGLSADDLRRLLGHRDESVRSWAVRLLVDGGDPGPASRAMLGDLARTDPSPLVRLYLASALQRLPAGERWTIAEALASRADDAADRDLPLMLWYGVEPLAAADPGRSARLAGASAIPLLRKHLARRLVLLSVARDARDAAGLAGLVDLLGAREEPAVRRDVLDGMLEALRGRKGVAPPESWAGVSSRLLASAADVREKATLLGLAFADPRASASLRAKVLDRSAPSPERRRALTALAERQVPGLAVELQGLLDDASLRVDVLRALAAYDEPGTAELLVKRYPSLPEAVRADAVATLASRPAFALVLLDAVEKKIVPRRDLSAFTVRQILALNDRRITEKLEAVWGTIRPTSTEKRALLRRYKDALGGDALRSADASRGRAVFGRTCQQCHRLHGTGGDVGPDLTGSQRDSLDYLLENILDPSAAVGRDYQLTNVLARDGRLISGIIRERHEGTLVVQTVNEKIALAQEDVRSLHVAEVSMMPEGTLENLTPEEIRDLIAYLITREQVPLPEPKLRSEEVAPPSK